MADRHFSESMKPVTMAVPPLGAILAYRSVYALCMITKENRLQATHYASCLVSGPAPIWGVWTVGGVFQRFYPRKSFIADAYPNRVWRRKQSTWSLIDVHDKTEEERRQELEKVYREGRRVSGKETAMVLPHFENVVRLRA